MPVISSHILNSVSGTHARGITVVLYRQGDPTPLFRSQTDEEGRLLEDVDLNDRDRAGYYELVFETGAYWEASGHVSSDARFIKQVVLRFEMTRSGGTYHHPIILSPNGYSTWISG